MIGGNNKYYKENGFHSCYVGDIDHTDLSNNIFCLYQTSSSTAQDNKHYNCHYQLNDTDTMYVYDIPGKYQEDYERFINSKYSQFSNEYKDRILEFFDIDRVKARYEVVNKGERPVVRQILFPKDSDRYKYIYERTDCDYEEDWEILDRIDEREVFDKQEYERTNNKGAGELPN